MSAKKKNTVTTTIEEATGIDDAIKSHLSSLGIETLGDIAETNFINLSSELTAKQQKSLFDVVYKANVQFSFDKSNIIESLPILSDNNKKTLLKAGFNSLGDFEGAFYPDIYDLIGFGPAKEILVLILAAGASVVYKTPDWSEADWKEFVEELIELNLVTWEDVAISLCSELNPPQVGTAVANQVKHNYPHRQAMKQVFKWFYAQSGKCEISGKRLWLEADHKVPKEQFIREGRDPIEANTLDNFQLLTKRENVIKRGSHRLGGLSFAQASAILVYVLLRYRPKSYIKFTELCRDYGLTMAAIRFQEAWALAIWLNKDGLYEIEENSD